MIGINTKRFVASFVAHPWIWLLGLATISIPSVYLASQLTIQSDFKFLLPQDKPSVVELNHAVERVGGIGSLIVAVECDDYLATERFIDDLALRLRELPKKYIRYLEYNIRDSKKFFEDNKYLYIDHEDLQEIHDRLARKIRFETLRQNPFYIALDEDTADFDVSDIEAKYKGKTEKFDYKDGYFFNKDLKLALLVIRPFGTSTGTAFAKDLVGRVRAIVGEMNPASYHPTLQVSYGGKYQKTLREYDQIRLDMLETLGLCLALVALVIYLYFLRLRAVVILTLPLFFGAAWTFALTQLYIGHLNSQTAFLGSIIVGNGVNYGIILLARYLEERRLKQSVEEALFTAIRTTWLGTLAAAITTSAGFIALAISEIKGFSEFGFIGGLGMSLCWLATFLLLPPLLVLFERLSPIVREGWFTSRQWEFLLRPIGAFVTSSPRFIATTGVLLLVASGYFCVRFAPDSLEYDFSKLRNRSVAKPGEKSLDRKIDEIFQQGTSPVVILLDHESQAEHVCDAVMSREQSYPSTQRTIASCKTLQSYLPERQADKLVLLSKIRGLLNKSALKFVKPDYREEIEKFRKSVSLRTLTLQDLPTSVSRNFRELDNRLGRLAFVYPREDANLSNGKKLIQFAERLSGIRLKDGSVVRMAGEAAIFADLLQAIIHDGPIATLCSFLAVAMLVALVFRRWRATAYVVGGLMLGMTYMLGAQAFLGVKLNFFNFIALPVTFGIGVDYSVNLLQRYRFEGRGSIRRVITTVGGAIVLCSFTTTISYLTLLTAKNQALASFGWLGLIGELACLFAAIVIMPALIHLYERRESHLKSVSSRVAP